MNSGRLWLLALVGALAVAGAVSLFSSVEPDGLERAAEILGLADEGEPLGNPPALLNSNTAPAHGDSHAGAALAGVAGCLMTFAVIFASLKVVRKFRGH